MWKVHHSSIENHHFRKTFNRKSSLFGRTFSSRAASGAEIYARPVTKCIFQNAKFIVFNAKWNILDTKFISLPFQEATPTTRARPTKFVICNTKLIAFGAQFIISDTDSSILPKTRQTFRQTSPFSRSRSWSGRRLLTFWTRHRSSSGVQQTCGVHFAIKMMNFAFWTTNPAIKMMILSSNDENKPERSE